MNLPWPESCDKVMAQIGAAVICGIGIVAFALLTDTLPKWIGARW